MHAIFMIYGERASVEVMLRDMEAQKHKLPLWKGDEKRISFNNGRVRLLPFGLYEYIFPREDIDAVLTSLKFDKYDGSQYEDFYLSKFKLPIIGDLDPLEFIRKALKILPIPEFKTDKNYLWITEGVMIIPIGIREDIDMTEDKGPYIGWTHEAL